MSLPRLDFSTLSYNAAKWSLPGKVLLAVRWPAWC